MDPDFTEIVDGSRFREVVPTVELLRAVGEKFSSIGHGQPSARAWKTWTATLEAASEMDAAADLVVFRQNVSLVLGVIPRIKIFSQQAASTIIEVLDGFIHATSFEELLQQTASSLPYFTSERLIRLVFLRDLLQGSTQESVPTEEFLDRFTANVRELERTVAEAELPDSIKDMLQRRIDVLMAAARRARKLGGQTLLDASAQLATAALAARREADGWPMSEDQRSVLLKIQEYAVWFVNSAGAVSTLWDLGNGAAQLGLQAAKLITGPE